MFKRFLDIFCFSFLFNLVLIIIILVFYKFGINLIEDIAGTLLLISFISFITSYIIYRSYRSSINLFSYKLGATNTGNKYKRILANTAKQFQSRTLHIYNQISKNAKSYKVFNTFLYLNAYVDSRNELIEDLVKAFDEIDDSSTENEQN